jgi:hypothetical protein
VTGNHKVILSWNASVPSLQSGGSAVGYCLYRSTKKHVADKKKKSEFRCNGCEQINIVPVTSTGCIDNWVHDATTYYYVATAINEDEKLSSASNEMMANVPPASQRIRVNPVGVYSLCQEPANSKRDIPSDEVIAK